ncbi:MAG TPA: response regulator transcription factor [Actinomycetota bacterium]|nr:response regulator transcription factor [Actinomycetota bacterium]
MSEAENDNVRVMVVDDTDHVRNMLVDMLELDGFDVVAQASSGSEAISVAAESRPDIVVMDYKMPGMDGLTAARQLRRERSSQVIILYTAYLDAALESEAREAGVALCVGKVEGLNQLERHITELCRDLRTT